MLIYYFDNFRGFSSTFLILNKINFLVGENSTGKTSVLKLVRILSSQKFWHNLEFSSPEADLGYFSEIATDQRKPFEIGIIDEIKKNQPLLAYKFKLIDRDGLPTVQSVQFIEHNHNIEIIFQDSVAKFRFSKIDTANIDESTKLEFFKNWIASSKIEGEFLDLRYPTPGGDISFILLRFEIWQKISDDLKKNAYAFAMPFANEMAWLAPIRTEPKRTYDSFKSSFNPDGTHAPYLLKSLLRNKRTTKNVENILRKFGHDSGLFQEIKIKQLGKTQISPFEIYITVNNVSQRITNVGYGVSQILPLIIEVIARDDGTWFALQQPEIHLHPRAQAAFGEFIYKSFVKENKGFIVETHSDYTIDRFRLRLNKQFSAKSKKQLLSQIVFFNRISKGNSLACIPILADGSLPSDQPDDFRRFFIREEMDLLTI
jgi:predicted ATPase